MNHQLYTGVKRFRFPFLSSWTYFFILPMRCYVLPSGTTNFLYYHYLFPWSIDEINRVGHSFSLANWRQEGCQQIEHHVYQHDSQANSHPPFGSQQSCWFSATARQLRLPHFHSIGLAYDSRRRRTHNDYTPNISKQQLVSEQPICW